MRIITGSARGITLETLEGEATRPTADRVKEAMFSMLQFDMEGRRVLDLFAGSGQLGLEALSRGASSAVFVDNSRDAINIIMKNSVKTKLSDRCRAAVYDFENYLTQAKGESFHIIFLDPPYNTDAMVKALRLIADNGLLAEGGIIACETDTAVEERQKRKKAPREEDDVSVLRDVFCGDAELMSLYSIRKTVRYGRTRLTLLEGV